MAEGDWNGDVTDGTSTISQTIEEIRIALREYIEAAYHIGHPSLIEQRRRLLDSPGVISQLPYLESTPRYAKGDRFDELPIHPDVRRVLESLAGEDGGGKHVLFNPPYKHQALALQACQAGGSLVVTTGTGSGKTETFLLPILARLLEEARNKPTSFGTPAVRALILYPMNALVNDQLGRLRNLFGDDRIVDHCLAWAERPIRFARYTSRTLYPGIRSRERDQRRLTPIRRFYIEQLDRVNAGGAIGERAQELIDNLGQRGKWPAKRDLHAWWGRPGSPWTNRDGLPIRAITRPDDAELLTRHEVIASPPDILVTNYSMLEYMMMRPLERPIFDATRTWLAENPEERFFLVIDEAHLYRGAQGTEVALLLRRLRSRLGVEPSRIQVIATSASFDNPAAAIDFAAQLSGKWPSDFTSLSGEIEQRVPASVGSVEDSRCLSEVDVAGLYAANTEQSRFDLIRPFLRFRGIDSNQDLEDTLFRALKDYQPLNELINFTMGAARSLETLARYLFPADESIADTALSALLALASLAREKGADSGLLPCRIHSFYRGLPGLWACCDPECVDSPSASADAPTGRLYTQPRASCNCGARVFELYTCRNCGSAYLRAYTDNLDIPRHLWSEQGTAFNSTTGVAQNLFPIDLLVEPANHEAVRVELDLVTGTLNPERLGLRNRQVFIRANRVRPLRDEDEEDEASASGEFIPCGVCHQGMTFGRTSIQNHQTKGDNPFQAVIARQLSIQPPSLTPATPFAPLRGRKVLVFSDSRQVAARLAPNLQKYSTQDVLRPLIVFGWNFLEFLNEQIARRLLLDDVYAAITLAAIEHDVRLRPQLSSGEVFTAPYVVRAAIAGGALGDPFDMLTMLTDVRASASPSALQRQVSATLFDRFTGLTSLALGSVAERHDKRVAIASLPDIEDVVTEGQKVGLVRAWLSEWAQRSGVWFQHTPADWYGTDVRGHRGNFESIDRWIPSPAGRRIMKRDWLPVLLSTFCEPVQGRHRLVSTNLRLDTSAEWSYCVTCKTTQRPIGALNRCVACGRDDVRAVDPDIDPVFLARKGYYRNPTTRFLEDPVDGTPIALIAAEHTAQLNTAQADEVFSKTELHELLFQDVDLGEGDETGLTAIDVLSCTTTMEVGIDIGALSGVAMRNMPPSRASYQQRAGRAGRRGKAVATVVAFGSADSHDEHCFTEPEAMIRGPVVDPRLNLDNSDIAERHVTAFLLQRYHQDRLANIPSEEQPSSLFEVLGSVRSFLDSDQPPNFRDFREWLRATTSLADELNSWLPTELNAIDRQRIIQSFPENVLRALNEAFRGFAVDSEALTRKDNPDEVLPEVLGEAGEEAMDVRTESGNLLDRLLYKGVLPRYAFPTDVATFYVFDEINYTRYRPAFKYTPSQGLPVALSQYAPGKQVWVDGKLWVSGAIYSPMYGDRFNAWEQRELYQECSACRYARTIPFDGGERGTSTDCPACGSARTFGPSQVWVRPPGFAHPVGEREGTSPDDQPEASYATRAKLVDPTPAEPEDWSELSDRLRHVYARKSLLVTNSGPRRDGYSYCLRCGLIRPASMQREHLGGAHRKPFPDEVDPMCPGDRTARSIVLGTDFITDVLLVSIKAESPIIIRPGLLSTDVALRTLAEALTIAGTGALQLDPGEIQAEFRPAISEGGRAGVEAEVYLYDTLSGGAGFARRLRDLGSELYERALRVLEECPEQCDRSCYRCLRSYRNKLDHHLLDRSIGVSLLGYLLNGDVPVLEKTRVEAANDRLSEDIDRHAIPDLQLNRNAPINVAGLGVIEAPILLTRGSQRLIVCISSPLTPEIPAEPALIALPDMAVDVEVHLEDELMISQNLPNATRKVLARLGVS